MLVVTNSWLSSIATASDGPQYQNQGQSKSAVNQSESIILYARGRDDTALNWSILATNESGAWQNITGKYGSPMQMQQNNEWQWSNFTWQNSAVPQGRRVGWRIYYTNTKGNVSVTPIMSFTIKKEVWVDDDAFSDWYDVCHVHTIREGITNITSDGGIVHVLSGTYFEHVVVNKQISLLGQDKTSTIIDEIHNPGNGVRITASHVTVSNFTIRNCRQSSPPHFPPDAAVYIQGDYTTLSNNIITDNTYGIFVFERSYNTIVGNTIKNHSSTAFMTYIQHAGNHAHDNTIYHNNYINNIDPVEDYEENIWDLGYPLGGNYWGANYTGVDSNPRDGIGDIPYNISEYDIDHYPFVQQDGWLLTNPPSQPDPPQGSTALNVGERYTFTAANVIHPYTYDVSCWFSWGDETSSGWSVFQASGSSFSASHIWEQTGTFRVQVTAKDALGRISIPSSPVIVTVSGTPPPPSPPPSPLVLESAAYVPEGVAFQVSVTVQGTPVENALVSFFNTVASTDRNGVARLQAPYVEQDMMYTITATHEEYQSTTTTITVLNQPPLQPEDSGGFVYGTVIDANGRAIQDAYVSVQLSPGVILKKFTTAQGYYLLIPAGMYAMEVGKRGYTPASLTDVMVNENASTKLDFVLEENLEEQPESPPGQQKDLVEAVIETGVFANKVSGELNIASLTHQYNITLYQEQLSIKNVSITPTNISFVVNATDFQGTIIALRLFSEKNLSDITVYYDNETIEQISFTDIFSLVDGNTTPVYTWIKITKENQTIAYVLVYVPHFSEHVITLSTIEEVVHVVDQITMVFSYIVVCILAGIVFFSPVFIRFIRHVYFQKKK